MNATSPEQAGNAGGFQEAQATNVLSTLQLGKVAKFLQGQEILRNSQGYLERIIRKTWEGTRVGFISSD